MSQVLSDYINVNNKQFAGNNILPVSLPQNPLSQTFYVDNQFGVVLRKISLYFRKIDTTSNLPISIHIRPVVNGKPSETEIVPDSHVFLLPNSGSYDATKRMRLVLSLRSRLFLRSLRYSSLMSLYSYSLDRICNRDHICVYRLSDL